MTDASAAVPARGPVTRGSVTRVGIATACSALCGYAVLYLAARDLDPAGFSLFGVFWGAFGLVSGAANGLLQESTREVRALRGQIVTAVDLRRRFGMDDRPDGELPMNVVVRTKDGSVSLLVDEIGDVLDVDDRAFERPPDTLDATTRRLVRGAYKLEGQLMLALETERAATLAA